MEINGRECKKTKLKNGDSILTYKKYKGKEYMKLSKRAVELGITDKIQMLTLSATLPDFIDIVIAGVEIGDKLELDSAKIIDYCENLDLDMYDVVHELIGDKFGVIMSREDTEKKVKGSNSKKQ